MHKYKLGILSTWTGPNTGRPVTRHRTKNSLLGLQKAHTLLNINIQNPPVIFFLLHCIYLSNYVWAHATAHIETRGDLQESLLSLYHVGPRNQARIMFVGKCLHPRRHLAYPKVCIILFDSPHSSLGKVLNGWSSRVSSNEGKDVKNVMCSWRFKSPHTQDTFRTNMDLQRAKKQSIRNGPQKQKWYAASLRCRKQQNPMN